MIDWDDIWLRANVQCVPNIFRPVSFAFQELITVRWGRPETVQVFSTAHFSTQVRVMWTHLSYATYFVFTQYYLSIKIAGQVTSVRVGCLPTPGPAAGLWFNSHCSSSWETHDGKFLHFSPMHTGQLLCYQRKKTRFITQIIQTHMVKNYCGCYSATNFKVLRYIEVFPSIEI